MDSTNKVSDERVSLECSQVGERVGTGFSPKALFFRKLAQTVAHFHCFSVSWQGIVNVAYRPHATGKKMSDKETAILSEFEAAQNNLVLQSADFSLDTISRMVDSKSIDASPSYQRRERWSPEAESLLIESFLLNIPVPPVYLAEDDFGTYSVIDGKQRITAIWRFITGQLVLKKLNSFHMLEGMSFSDLPRALRNALAIRPYLRVVTLLKQSNDELKYEVFTRLNSGGEPLLPQEIRNALFRGPMNDAIVTMSQAPFLRQQLKIITEKETAFTSMQDIELVLRFLTLYSNWRSFGGDMRRSLDQFMMQNQHANADWTSYFTNVFYVCLTRCQILWGDDCFKRPSGHAATRDQFLSGLYDAQMLAVSELDETSFALVRMRAQQVNERTRRLFQNDSTFDDSVRRSTNTPTRLRYRVESIASILMSA